MGHFLPNASPSHASFAWPRSRAQCVHALRALGLAGAGSYNRERGSPGPHAERGGVGRPPRPLVSEPDRFQMKLGDVGTNLQGFCICSNFDTQHFSCMESLPWTLPIHDVTPIKRLINHVIYICSRYLN